MYLTDKKNGHPRNLRDHEELEVLLESFSKQVEEIVNETETISVSMSAPCSRPCLLIRPKFVGKCSVYARNCGTNPRLQPQRFVGTRLEGEAFSCEVIMTL